MLGKCSTTEQYHLPQTSLKSDVVVHACNSSSQETEIVVGLQVLGQPGIQRQCIKEGKKGRKEGKGGRRKKGREGGKEKGERKREKERRTLKGVRMQLSGRVVA
jgi:hypothetical protein